jgi:hypothetical protein
LGNFGIGKLGNCNFEISQSSPRSGEKPNFPITY